MSGRDLRVGGVGGLTGTELRGPAAAAAALVLGASAGNGFVAVVALLFAAGPVAGAAAVLAMAATVARWGTADLGAIAGDQAVLGAAVGTGSPALVASSGLAAAGLVLVARRAADGEAWTSWAGPVALGVGAAVLAAGPSPVDAAELVVRAGSTVVGVALALGVATVLRRRAGLERGLAIAGVGAGALGLVLAILG